MCNDISADVDDSVYISPLRNYIVCMIHFLLINISIFKNVTKHNVYI